MEFLLLGYSKPLIEGIDFESLDYYKVYKDNIILINNVYYKNVQINSQLEKLDLDKQDFKIHDDNQESFQNVKKQFFKSLFTKVYIEKKHELSTKFDIFKTSFDIYKINKIK